MSRFIRFSLLSAWACLVIGSVLSLDCLAQGTGAPSPQPGGSPGGGPQPGAQPAGSNRTNRSTPFPDTPRPFFLSGSVRLADGTLPPERVLIERICNGRVRPEGYTDSQGDFSILLGAQPGAFADATVDLSSQPFGLDAGLRNGVNPQDLNGCEIRASLSGFLSTTITLTSRRAFDDPNIGVLHLRRIASVNGFTFSVTTASAPKDAQNAFKKGIDNAKKQKWADAERDFLKAVQLYPRYAVAWHELGRVYQEEKKFDAAARAQNEAIKIDPKFAGPYGQLTFLAAAQSKWDDVVAHSSQVIKLSPNVPADVYFYSAVAHFNLRQIDVARDHARQATTLDTQHRIPRAHHLLGVILAQTKEYDEAAVELRLYLKLAPNAPEAAAVKQILEEMGNAVAEPARD
jgi:tetratricopeptide (TPR) repeat protein